MAASGYASDVAFTPTVKALQAKKGSRHAYARMEEAGSWQTRITPDLEAFIAEQRSVFLATVNAQGQPYIQHRGGPPGFLRVLDEQTLGFVDFAGNRQYISTGNLAENPRAHLFLIDYRNRRRVKVWGEARVVPADAALLARLMPEGYKAKPEQIVLFTVSAWDANCPQHIPPRFEAAEVAAELREKDRRIEALGDEIERLRRRRDARDLPQVYEHILGSVSDGIHVIDLDGVVLVENAAAARMLGWQGQSLVGKCGHDSIHHHHADGGAHRIEDCPIHQTCLDGKARVVRDDVFWRQDGSSFPVEYRADPLCDSDGHRYGVAVVFRDVTERKRADRMQAALLEISECAHDCESPDDMYPRIHRIIGTLLPAENFFVALYEAKDDELRFPYFVDTHDAAPGARALADGGLTADVISSGQPLLIGPEQQRLRLKSGESIVGTDSIDWLGVPLRTSERTVGALVVQSYLGTTRYSEADKHLLQFVSTQIATAIERKQQEVRLRRMAQFDALTDLPNRALFSDRLEVALAHAKRRDEKLALLYFDLDRFKPVNDAHGHAIGDALLTAVAARARGLLRASDTIARLGGDEFIALIHPIGSADDAVRAAEKIRAALNEPFEIQGQAIRIGASIGVAIHSEHGTDEGELTRRADAAMYRAKRQGSNRVVLAD